MSDTRAEVPPSLDGGGTQMPDLQMTKLCADADGVTIDNLATPRGMLPVAMRGNVIIGTYNPLHDDAQAMALVKKFNLYISGGKPWKVYECLARKSKYMVVADDLNEAIVQCVAKMQFDRTVQEASAEATDK